MRLPQRVLCGALSLLAPVAFAEGSSEPVSVEASGAKIAKPDASTQKQKSVEARGINPCNTPDPGFGIYDRWRRDIVMGQMIAPQVGGVNARGEFDLMIHFHGHEPARKEWVQVMDGAVLVGIDLGTGSGPYQTSFAMRGTLKSLVGSIERAMQKRTKKPAKVRKLGLSGWSAGYGAIQNCLADPWGMEHVDSVILLDGLHCGYNAGSLNEPPIRPFIDFARKAADSERLMVVTHSSIIPPGYASTTETANFLVAKLGGRPQKARTRSGDPMGLELISRFSRGNFHVRGFSGNDTLDHCAHLGLYRDILKAHILPRWHSPRGSAR